LGRCSIDERACGLIVTAYTDQGAEGSDFLDDIMMNLSRIGSRAQWYKWRNEVFNQRTVDYHDEAAMRAWHAAIYRQHGPRLAGRKPCTLRRPMYYASRAPQILPHSTSVHCDGDTVCGNR